MSALAAHVVAEERGTWLDLDDATVLDAARMEAMTLWPFTQSEIDGLRSTPGLIDAAFGDTVSDLGLSRPTVDSYLAHLEAVFLIQLVPAWSTNLTARVVRRPKLTVTDTGLAALPESFSAPSPSLVTWAGGYGSCRSPRCGSPAHPVGSCVSRPRSLGSSR